MASAQSHPGYRHIRHTIRHQAKAVLVVNDIRPATKRGNREFNIALNRLAMQPYDSLDAAAQAGQELGHKIVDLSKAKGKSNLDAGVIRQMVLLEEIPTVSKTAQKPAGSAQVAVAASKAKTEKTASAPAESEPDRLEAATEPEAASSVGATATVPPEPDAADAEPEIVEAEEDEAPAIPETAAEAEAEPTAVVDEGEEEPEAEQESAEDEATEPEATTDDLKTQPRKATPV